MAARWLRVYRAAAATRRTAAITALPPERNFPLPVVIAHGIFAITTLVLVLLTALSAGRS